MASDIKYNGTAYPDRTGNDKWGTFFDTIKPPAYSGLSGGALHQVWGSRVAEISGRARGLSQVGTVPALGTLVVTFPAGYFTFIPIVKFTELTKRRLYDTEEQKNDSAIKEQFYIVDNESSSNYLSAKREGVLERLSFGLLLRNITPTGFSICHKPNLYYSTEFYSYPQGAVKIIYWHARGC